MRALESFQFLRNVAITSEKRFFAIQKLNLRNKWEKIEKWEK